MIDETRDPTTRGVISVYPETWILVNSEKRYKECMDDVIRRVFKEWKEFREIKNQYDKVTKELQEVRIEGIKQIDTELRNERLGKMLDIKKGGSK